MRKRQFYVLIAVLLIPGSFFASINIKEALMQFKLPPGWSSFFEVYIAETAGVSRTNEPIEVYFQPKPGTCYSTNEIRVIAPDGVTEVPSQVYDVVKHPIGQFIISCRVAFLADCPANGKVKYYIIYNNPTAEAPVYDGLRVYEEIAGDSYNVTAVKGGVEKNYARIFWKNLLDLYSNGSLVTWPGGPSGWEFSQINIASLWADAWETPWFGSGKTLSLVESGPIFAEFNYSETYGQDLWGLLFDYNVSTSTILRVYYQPDLNPLVKYEKTYNIHTNLANYTIKPGAYLDFKLANSTSQAIYQNFTYSQGVFGTTTVPVETTVWQTIWLDSWMVYGWWSYNGSRPDSTDKPNANIGLIPTYSGGTIPPTTEGDYSLSVSQQIENDDHHCSQWINGKYNAIAGDIVETKGYVIVYKPIDTDAELIMNEKATTLRDPLKIGTWMGRKYVVFTETAGVDRVAEPVDVFVTFDVEGRTDHDPTKEVRVLDPCGNEVPFQVWNITYDGENAISANVVFLVDCPAFSSVTYTIMYNNPYASAPVYDGLRVYEEIAGDSYNVTAVKGGVEKNYARIFWKNLLDLYSNGSLVTWPGGPSGWEFSQINIASLWADAWETPWFGSGKTLSLVESGPIFAEFNYSETYGSDFWGTMFDYNVTTTTIVRIYYQPNLNPLVKFQKTFNINTNLDNYTVSTMAYLDFKLANSTSQAIYQNFTYSQGVFGTTTVPVETTVWQTIWLDSWMVYGWWSYNGSRPDSTDKPNANIGLIPTYSGGTIPPTTEGDYSLSVSQQIENDDHHCSQWINGKYNGTNGDYIQVKGYIFTYNNPVDINAEPIMNEAATKLRNPLSAEIELGVRDISLTSIISSKHIIGVGYTVKINLTITNNGDLPECFCVKVYANETLIQTLAIKGVAPADSAIIAIEWNTSDFAKGQYIISAYALPVPDETNVDDNTLVDSIVVVTIFCDVNGDGSCDMADISLMIDWFMTSPPNWNPNCDVNDDLSIDMADISLAIDHFMESDP